jgi:alkylated DNA repair dioxygenase AlkB
MERSMDAPNLRYLPCAVADADRLFEQLNSEISWDERMEARRTASFGRPYDYSGQVYAPAPMPAVVLEIARVAGEVAGHPFDNCLCNLYESGLKSMGFHRDSYEDLTPSSWIAIASFGATRSLVFRSNDKARTIGLRLEHGSILLMDRATQGGWMHAVPREPSAGPRISLTFRRFQPSGGEDARSGGF